jgi:hypothetical protein
LSAPQEEVGARLGRRKKWQDAVIMTIYIPLDLKKELERRARAKRMSLSEYAVRLLLSGLEAEREKEANKGVEAKEVP